MHRIPQTVMLLMLAGLVGSCNNDVTSTNIAGNTNGYSLTISPNPLTVGAGNVGSATLTVNRFGNFTGTVNITVTSNPPGLCSVSPNVISGAPTVSTAATVFCSSMTRGTFMVTIQGSAPPDSLTTPSVTLTLVVN